MLDRFEDKILHEPNSGCWLWTGALNQDGYAMFWHEGQARRAHRIAYEIHVGPIPDGLQLDHLCRVRCCVNPDHVEPVSCRENIRRGETGIHEREKTHCPQGHPYDERNTYRYRNKRYCRTCMKQRKRRP